MTRAGQLALLSVLPLALGCAGERRGGELPDNGDSTGQDATHPDLGSPPDASERLDLADAPTSDVMSATDGRDSAVDAAATPVACGSLGQPCCRSAVCLAAGTVCGTDETCQRCGEPGRPCCPGNSCPGGCCSVPYRFRVCVRPGEVCSTSAGICGASGACAACGGLGQRCCGSRDCTAGGTVCDAATTTCVACGGPGEPCCGLSCKTPGHACDRTNRCAPCGGEGKPCCLGSSRCDDPSTACDLLPGNSVQGVCRRCGGPGQVCCGGGACSDPGTRCLSNRCEPCGSHAQPCCANDRCTGEGTRCFARPQCDTCSYCSSICGSCRLCGGFGQTCCVDGSCRAPHTCSAQGVCQ